jgi:hypothetical protein
LLIAVPVAVVRGVRVSAPTVLVAVATEVRVGDGV